MRRRKRGKKCRAEDARFGVPFGELASCRSEDYVTVTVGSSPVVRLGLEDYGES
jgi:hypothetical protein